MLEEEKQELRDMLADRGIIYDVFFALTDKTAEMSALQFSFFLRISTGEESIFHENKLFQTFDTENQGWLSFEMFERGLQGLRFVSTPFSFLSFLDLSFP